MMSLPVWVLGSMFLLGVFVEGSLSRGSLSRGSLFGNLCLRGSLSRGLCKSGKWAVCTLLQCLNFMTT